MQDILGYIDIILLLLLVVFLFFSFRKVLGKKVGYEVKEAQTQKTYTSTTSSTSTKDFREKESESTYKYPVGSLMQKIEKIEENDEHFSQKSFENSSKKAFTMIVNDFNAGKIDNIKHLLSDDMYESFLDNFNNREQDYKNSSIEIKSFIFVDIIDIDIKENFDTFISVKYVTLQKRDYKNVDKASSFTKEISETWVFGKNIKENTSIWKLVKTY